MIFLRFEFDLTEIQTGCHRPDIMVDFDAFRFDLTG